MMTIDPKRYVKALQEVIDTIPIDIQKRLFVSKVHKRNNPDWKLRIHYVASNKSCGSNADFFKVMLRYIKSRERDSLISMFAKNHWLTLSPSIASERAFKKAFPTMDEWKEEWTRLIKQYIADKTLL